MNRNLKTIASITFIRKFTGRRFNSSTNGWRDPLFELTVDDDFWAKTELSKLNAYPVHVMWESKVFNVMYDQMGMQSEVKSPAELTSTVYFFIMSRLTKIPIVGLMFKSLWLRSMIS